MVRGPPNSQFLLPRKVARELERTGAGGTAVGGLVRCEENKHWQVQAARLRLTYFENVPRFGDFDFARSLENLPQ
jgi:hypothetical protein